MAEVEIRAVSKAFGKAQAVSDLSLTVADGGFERRGGPEMKRLGRLNIIMPIKKNGGFAGSVERFGVNERMQRGGNDFKRLKSGGTKIVGDPARGAFNIGLMFGFGADARNAKKLVQLSKVFITT